MARCKVRSQEVWEPELGGAGETGGKGAGAGGCREGTGGIGAEALPLLTGLDGLK